MRTACSQGPMRSQSGQVSWIAPHRHRLLRTDGVVHAKGRTRVGYRYTAHSIIGSTFHCPIEAETMLEERPAVVPVISGQAWITGIHQHILDLIYKRSISEWIQVVRFLANAGGRVITDCAVSATSLISRSRRTWRMTTLIAQALASERSTGSGVFYGTRFCSHILKNPARRMAGARAL